MLEISLKLTFSTRSYSNYHVLICHLSSLSVKNILNDAKSLTVHLWRVRNLYLHSFYEIHAKGTLLGCILSQHSCINPFFSIPHSGLPSWFLSGRVHLRLFKLTGCLMKTLKEKKKCCWNINNHIPSNRQHLPTLKISLPYVML